MELLFHPDSARKLSSNLYNMSQCQIYSGKLLMMGRNCPKHVELRTKINLEINASVGFIVNKFVMMHGHMNVKYDARVK